MEVFYRIAAFVLFTAFYVQGQIVVTQPPVNTGGRIGQAVQLNCSTTLTSTQTLNWAFNGAGSTDDQPIVTATANDLSWDEWARPLFSIDSQRNLMISNFTHDRAGKYTCRVAQLSPIENEQFQVEVMAMDDLSLESEDVFEGQEATVSCAVNISGLFNPTLRLFKENKEVSTYTISKPNAPDGEYRLLKYGYNFNTTNQDNDVEFICDLVFVDYEKNPSYRDLAYINVTVFHGVVDIDITPNSDNREPTVEVGDYLNCSARGEPEPEYRWTSVDNSTDVRNGSSLEVREDMIGRNQYMCTAYNTVNGTYYDINKTVTFNAVEHGQGGSPMVLPSFVLSFILATFITIIS